MSKRRYLTAAIASATAALVMAGTAMAVPADVSIQSIKQVAKGLDEAWAVDFLPDGTAIFTQKDAKTVSTLDKSGKVTKVLDVPGVSVTKEAGLLGLAVSPKFAVDKTVFIYFTTGSDNRIAKFKLGETKAPTPILTGIPRGAQFHQGGRIKFGPDGFLYAGTGDAKNGNNAQNKDSLGGKILRITTDGKAAPGNPFNSPVYSYGHRNVQGLTWAGGTLYSSEIGESTVDELNKIEPGKNYGWPKCEGSCNQAGMTNPVKTWPTSSATPSGIAFYKGSLYMSALKGGTYKLNTSGAGGKIYTNLGRTRDEVAGPDGQLWVVTPGGIYNADGS
ncbi:Glucose/arabinose dehydrogenase, beta-propeller fold [Amycolatopsis xylanica]|uniref:Glucose/arabinose dehydrogenase, beta-propeller fold n=1 Tax=Amycolatopsis xylanica TaxID=589385 RepID=A0A1H3E099_9PSEU|nr:PQQ-dependent sugar dehydrogenase [Amycolatopsis xylanica]SDX71314.1 Glucose/arabinose dehydrogenase, beta-propeller fold [Amycolatopsis xylanica]